MREERKKKELEYDNYGNEISYERKFALISDIEARNL